MRIYVPNGQNFEFQKVKINLVNVNQTYGYLVIEIFGYSRLAKVFASIIRKMNEKLRLAVVMKLASKKSAKTSATAIRIPAFIFLCEVSRTHCRRRAVEATRRRRPNFSKTTHQFFEMSLPKCSS